MPSNFDTLWNFMAAVSCDDPLTVQSNCHTTIIPANAHLQNYTRLHFQNARSGIVDNSQAIRGCLCHLDQKTPFFVGSKCKKSTIYFLFAN